MGKKIAAGEQESRPAWETLEAFARVQVQEWIQRLLEEEMTELLGRQKSERRAPGEAVVYRNGYGKARRLTLANGTIVVRRPRVRGMEERLESQILPLFEQG